MERPKADVFIPFLIAVVSGARIILHTPFLLSPSAQEGHQCHPWCHCSEHHRAPPKKRGINNEHLKIPNVASQLRLGRITPSILVPPTTFWGTFGGHKVQLETLIPHCCGVWSIGTSQWHWQDSGRGWAGPGHVSVALEGPWEGLGSTGEIPIYPRVFFQDLQCP